MKRMLKEARPSKFEEIIAFVSLYRPGPMDLILTLFTVCMVEILNIFTHFLKVY